MVEIVRLRHRLRRPPPASTAVSTAQPARRPLTHAEIIARVSAIAARAKGLRPPMRHDPERWHIDKSDLVRSIERLEQDLRRGIVPGDGHGPGQ